LILSALEKELRAGLV